jgi:hypothetical protein
MSIEPMPLPWKGSSTTIANSAVPSVPSRRLGDETEGLLVIDLHESLDLSDRRMMLAVKTETIRTLRQPLEEILDLVPIFRENGSDTDGRAITQPDVRDPMLWVVDRTFHHRSF